MRTIVLAAAIAAMLAVPVTASPSMAASGDPAAPPATTDIGHFDLSIDLISPTPAAVKGYLASLPEATRNAILDGCSSYVVEPDSARSIHMFKFCSVAVGG